MKNMTYSLKTVLNKVVLILFSIIIFIILGTGNSQAVLQSNGGTAATYNLSDWMIKVRQMEQNGGAMGLTETLNSNLTSSTSNGIDVHMEKNTEYGAMAILSASSYGNPNVIADGQTTTGNVTGVVMKINKEWVAVCTSDTSVTNFVNAVSRYKNIYTTSYVSKLGDAILNWHGSTATSWINDRRAGLVRAYSGSIFSYYGLYNNSNGGNGANSKTYASRAVIVIGSGF